MVSLIIYISTYYLLNTDIIQLCILQLHTLGWFRDGRPIFFPWRPIRMVLVCYKMINPSNCGGNLTTQNFCCVDQKDLITVMVLL